MIDTREKKEKIIEAGDIITINDIRYRVVSLDSQMVLAELDTNKLNISILDTETIITPIVSGEYEVEKYSAPQIAIDKNNKKYIQRMNLISDIKENYGGDILGFVFHHTKSSRDNLMAKHGIDSRTTFWYILRIYIQSGLDYASLMPSKHRYPDMCSVNYTASRTDSNGRKIYKLMPKDFENMTKVIEMYKKQEFLSLREAYEYLRDNFYHEIVTDENGHNVVCVKGYGEKPTRRQFDHYYYAITPVVERKLANEKLKDFINNDRMLTGGKMEDAPYPGALVEVDACEIDISMIGTYRPQYTIGRPTLYIMRDVYSKLILAMSLGLTKNSREALFKLFANLAANKTLFCERYGIMGVTSEMWPSNIIPQRIRCDRGADFVSYEFSRVCQELDTIKDLVPGGVGSMKGDIEQFFHQFGTNMSPFVKGHGLILKDYGSKHHTEAVLNILDVEKMCILYILYYNNKVMRNYPSTIEMEVAKVRLSPIGIWNYGIENISTPMPIRNTEQYLNVLYMHDIAQINNKGVHFRNLIYSGSTIQELVEIMLKNKRHKSDIEILYDPNNIQKIKYRLKDGTCKWIYLNTSLPEFKNLDGYTFAMWSKCLKYKKKRNSMAIEEDESLDARYAATQRQVVEVATGRSPVLPSATHMKQNREYETNMNARRESISHVEETELNNLTEGNTPLSLPENVIEDVSKTGSQTELQYVETTVITDEQGKTKVNEAIEYDDEYDPEAHMQRLYNF